jgi:photosystem II stability/assembly factor-like uncharacterized protein
MFKRVFFALLMSALLACKVQKAPGNGTPSPSDRATTAAESHTRRMPDIRRQLSLREAVFLNGNTALAFPGYFEGSVDEEIERHWYPLLTRDGGSTWTQMHRDTMKFEAKTITFSDVLHGWAATSDSELWKTENGGSDWAPFARIEYEGAPLKLRAIKSIDESEGWGLGSDALWHTQDGGRTWTKFQFHESAVNEMCFQGPYTGWILCGNWSGTAPNVVYRTVDGGTNWDKSEIPGTDEDEGHDLFFINGRKGWLSNDRGIYRTEDGGVTWKKQALPQEAERLDILTIEKGMVIYSIYFVSELEGWAAGDKLIKPDKVEGTLLHTTDGGNSWKEIRTRLPGYGFGPVFFANAQEGWLVGAEPNKEQDEEQGFMAGTIIYHSRDGGRSWRPVLTLEDPGRLVETQDSGNSRR